MEIVTYGADNKESGRAFYSSPNERYKYLRFVDMAVIGSDKVSVLAFAFNTARSGGKESELILANLDKGNTAVSAKIVVGRVAQVKVWVKVAPAYFYLLKISCHKFYIKQQM